MSTNYQQLCANLFGIDGVAKTREVAAQLKTSAIRNMDRKKFTPADVDAMKRLLARGCTVQQVAERFDASRSTVSRYLNPKPKKGCTLRMTYMYGRRPCTVIDVDFLHQKVYIQNRTDDLLHRAFGVVEDPCWEDFQEFLKSRCFTPTRGNIKTELRALGLTDYDPLQIVEKTNGHTAEDSLWLKFQYYPAES